MMLTTDNQSPQPMTLSSYNKLLSSLLSVPETSQQWVTAELLDVAVRGGHCYMELVEKDHATGRTVARNRGIIWANNYGWMSTMFRQATGQALVTGLRVMVCVSANFHPVFGLSLVITDINPSYTLGELQRRRMLILERLKAEGIFDMNRTLPIPVPANRIAVISAHGAAGYGDFIHQLYSSPRYLRFSTQLFEAVMQGDKAAQSIISALQQVAERVEDFDVVVIIRGGGATSDLATLDDYELAAHVAQFPLPVIVGVGHERDVTVLDYVAALRVKTPTAAAEWLINRGSELLDALQAITAEILHATTSKLAVASRRLEYCAGALPTLATASIARSERRLDRCAAFIASAGVAAIEARRRRLAIIAGAISIASTTCTKRSVDRLDALGRLLNALSPEATLRRGYTITRVKGTAITDASSLAPGTVITTTFANGTIDSVISQ